MNILSLLSVSNIKRCFDKQNNEHKFCWNFAPGKVSDNWYRITNSNGDFFGLIAAGITSTDKIFEVTLFDVNNPVESQTGLFIYNSYFDEDVDSATVKTELKNGATMTLSSKSFRCVFVITDVHVDKHNKLKRFVLTAHVVMTE